MIVRWFLVLQLYVSLILARRDTQNRRYGAFTLVELLVVISIIALLVAILLPALHKARYQAQRTVCAGHIKSQANVQLVYTADNEGHFPMHWGGDPICAKNLLSNFAFDKAVNGVGIIERVWDAYHDRYLPDGEIFECPAMFRAGYIFTDSSSRYQGDTGQGTAEGGWDALMDDGTPVPYVLMGYGWLANYKPGWAGASDPADAFMWYPNGETPWPNNLAECNAKAGLISHTMIGPDSGLEDLVWNMGHGGKGGTGFGSLEIWDNPTGYGDGHVEVHAQEETLPRGSVMGGNLFYWF